MTGPDLLLIGHGSRSPAATKEFGTLVGLVGGGAPGLRIGAGFLELADPPIDVAVDDLVASGATDVVAVPYVLFGAGHLKDDGPAVLGRARARHPDVRLRLARDIGLHPAVLDVAEDRARAALKRLPDTDDTAVVLVGRGSTDPDACADFVKFARLLEDGRGLGRVEAAFVAMTRPGVEDALERTRLLGAEAIAVVPLFLFDGALVERIGERAAAWAADHPEVAVSVAAHLGPDPRLADVILERHREAHEGDVRMNCDLCAYRVRLPGYEEKVGTPLTISPPESTPRGWRARRAANQAAADAAERRERPRRGLGRRAGGGGPAAPDRGEPAIRILGLRHRWPDGTDALAGVDLEVAQGERLAVLGPNGSGKTTLALHLIGALERSSGQVDVTGLPVTKPNLAEIRRRVGLVFQDPDDQLLLPTVGADVALGPANLGLTGEALAGRVSVALDLVGLTDAAERAPQHLSMGERRRAALAGVLAVHPEILVLDEPSANLDPSARRDVVDIVQGLEITTIVVTHDLPLALELCPRSVVLDHGRVVADGPTAALLANPALMAAHRLELPYGFVPGSVSR